MNNSLSMREPQAPTTPTATRPLPSAGAAFSCNGADQGLYKMGARYYQPELGRWTQQDPSGAEANVYLYVGGNPVNFVDPSGVFSFNPFSFILEAINLEDALEDLLDKDQEARDLADNLAGGAATAGFATACAYFAGLLALPTAGIGGLAAGGVCAVLSVAIGALIQKGIGDG